MQVSTSILLHIQAESSFHVEEFYSAFKWLLGVWWGWRLALLTEAGFLVIFLVNLLLLEI